LQITSGTALVCFSVSIFLYESDNYIAQENATFSLKDEN
jgi:hypothetical protein